MNVHAMRKLFVVLAVLAVVGIAPAFAQAANITITKTGFVPSTVTIHPGESITWTNSDTVDHQVSSTKATLSSPVIHTGQTYSFMFATAGNFSVTDLLNKKLKSGTVSVKTAGAAQTVSIATSSSSTNFNGTVTLTGVVSSHAANETVTIRGQSYGSTAFLKLADVKTGAGGVWTYTAHPTIRTVFDSMWGKNASTQITVGVRPLVSIHALSGNRFSTKVLAARSFAGRFVQLQRRSAGQWTTLKRVRLGSTSAATLKASLPRGNSTLRFAFSVNQAGAGYLAGFSRTLVYHRG
jgi:Cupredoxin-like domain